MNSVGSTEVSVETGLRAAEKLQSILDGRERGTDVLELKVQLGRIGEAVRAVVPQEMWAAIIEKLEELEQHSEALDVGTDSFDDDDDDAYGPQLFGGQCGAARGGLAHRQPMAEGNERHHAARAALIRRSTKSHRDRVGRPSPHAGQAVIVALRRAQRPVWAPGVRILSRRPLFAGDRGAQGPRGSR